MIPKNESLKWWEAFIGWIHDLRTKPNHYSLSLTAPLPSGQNVFVPGATCKDACRGWPPQATDWIVGAFWCLLAPEPPAAAWALKKRKTWNVCEGTASRHLYSYFSTTPSGLRPQLAYFSSTHLVGRWQHSPVVPATMTVRAFIPCTLQLECTPESAFWSFCINCIRATPMPTSALATKASIVCRLGSNLTRHSKRPCSGCCLVWLVERLCNVMDVFHILLLELRNLTRSRLTRGAAVSESSQATVQQDHNKSNRYSNEGKQCGS